MIILVIKLINTIIFDLDGTLLHTLEDLYLSVNFALRKYGLPERTYEEIQSFIGNGVFVLIQRAIGNGDKKLEDEVYQTFCEYYGVHKMDHCVIFPGIEEMLKKLKQQNYHLAIVSNKYHLGVQEMCKPLFGKYISFMLGENEKNKKKPAPDMILEVMQHYQVTSDNVLYVGDSEVDIQTAKNAQVKVAIVNWGYRKLEYLKQFGADMYLSTPQDLFIQLEEEKI